MRLLLVPFLLISIIANAQRSSLVLHLPEKSGYQSKYCIYDESRKEYLRSYSGAKNGGSYIEIYDSITGKLKTEEYFKDFLTISSFLKVSDSEYIIFDDHSYYLVEKGKIKSQFTVNEPSRMIGAFESFTAGMQFNPIFMYQGKLVHVNSFVRLYKPYQKDNQHRTEGLVQLAELEKKSITLKIPLPAQLDTVDYGELNRFSAIVKGNQLVIAPSYSNEILIVDLQSMNHIYPIVAKNKYYQVTKPYANMRNTVPDNKAFYDRMSRHYSENSYYAGILHDPYKKQYYRILISPHHQNRNSYLMKVIVLDEYFALKAAHDIPEHYKIDGMFVSKAGLNIINHEKYKENTDLLTFDAFVF